MIADFLSLYKLGGYQLKNKIIDALRNNPISTIFILSLGGGFFYGYVYLSWLLLRYIYNQDVYGVLFATRLVEFLLFIAVGMALMSSLTTAIANFYLSKDLEFQFSLPVSFTSWTVYRFSLVFLQSSWMLMLFGGTFIWIYLYLGETNWYVQVLGVIAFGMLCSLPIIIATILCMVLVKIFPAKRVHQVFLVLTIILVSSLVFLFRYMEPERFIGPGGLEQFRGFIDLISPRRQPYNPAVWTANLMASLNQQRWAEAWPHGLKLLVLFSFLMGALLFTAQKLYRSSWDRALQSLSGEGDLKPANEEPGMMSRLLGHPWWSQEIREVLLFFRDPSQWSQVFVLIALLGLYMFSVTKVPENLLGATAYIMAMLNSIFVAFISLSISSRFVFTSFSADGQAIWLMKTAPDGWVKFMRSKLIVYGLPCLIFSMLLSIGSGYFLGIRGELLGFVALHALWDGILMVMLSLGLGMRFINPWIENPLKLIVSPGGLFLMASGLFMAAVHTVMRLSKNLSVLNHFLTDYYWPDMQDGQHVPWFVGLIVLELIFVIWLTRSGIRHLRSGDYAG